MGNLFGLLVAVLVSMLLLLLVAGLAGDNTTKRVNVDGYIPSESGEQVRCTYERRTTYINKGTTPIFTDYLHCTEFQ